MSAKWIFPNATSQRRHKQKREQLYIAAVRILKAAGCTGGAEGDRTPDLRIANAALCQTELLPHYCCILGISTGKCQIGICEDKFRAWGAENFPSHLSFLIFRVD
jgi:hypothetical protein